MVKPAAFPPALVVLCWTLLVSLTVPAGLNAQQRASSAEVFAGAWHTEYRDSGRGVVRGIAAIVVKRGAGEQLDVGANYQEMTAQGMINHYPVWATLDRNGVTLNIGSDVVITLAPSGDRNILRGRWADRTAKYRKGRQTDAGWQAGEETWKRAIPMVTTAVITLDGQKLDGRKLAAAWRGVLGVGATMRLEGEGLPLRYPPGAHRRIEYLQVTFKDPLIKEGSFAFGAATAGDGWVEFPISLFRGLTPGRKLMVLNGATIPFELSFGDDRPAPSSPAVKARWRTVHPVREADGEGWSIDSASTGRLAVLAAAYHRDGQVALEITLGGADVPVAGGSSGAAVRVQLVDAFGGHTAEVPAPVPARFDATGVATVPFKMEAVLKAVRAQVNRNAVHADVRVVLGNRAVVTRTERPLHLLRQKLVLFIPGVCGSRIKVAGHPREEAFPEWSYVLPEFAWLRSYPSGWPESVAVELKLFEKFEVASAGREAFGVDVYALRDLQALQRPDGHPVLTRTSPYLAEERRSPSGSPTPVPYQPRYVHPYYVVKPWPYDWRLRLDHAVDLLMGRVPRRENDPVWPPYETPPSLARVLQAAKEAHPFLDDRLAIASHSTGGLISRGALMEPGVEGLVDQAFFINVPFWGAPKAYFVFLTGDMGLAFIRPRFMRDVAPNTPVVYYLAPTERYRDDVAHVFNARANRRERVKRRPGQDVSQFVGALVAEARLRGLYPPGNEIDPWNRQLEADARKFHARLQGEPRIGFANTWVFWSSTHELDTHGAVGIGEKPVMAPKAAPRSTFFVSYDRVRGDGTVPVVSQQADFPREQLIGIPGRPDHVAATNQEFVWQTILDRLGRRF